MPAPRENANPLRVRALAAAVGLALAVAAAGGAGAQPRAEPFTVRDVAVDVVAPAGAAPRDAALAEAQRRAAQRLFDRLVPRDQLARVPRLGAAPLADLVETVEVQAERVVGARWIGRFAIAFRPAAVRELLIAAGIPFAEATARPLLIVPVYAPPEDAAPAPAVAVPQAASPAVPPAPANAPAAAAGAVSPAAAGLAPVVWEPNPWREAWLALPPADGLLRWQVARGDDADRAELPEAAALAGDPARLAALARRHGAGAAATATARPDPGGVTVTLLRRTPAGDEETLVESVAASPGEAPEPLLARAALATARGIEERWKASVLVAAGDEGRLTARVPLRGLADWVAMRARLAELPMVRRVTLANLSRERALVEIEYAGEEPALRAAMGERGLALAADEGPGAAAWRLTLAGAGN